MPKPRRIGINVSVDPKTVKNAGKVILEILKSKVDQSTMQTALNVLGSCTDISGTTINGNSVTIGREE